MQWDCILILGPFYHLKEIESRLKVLELACKHVKPGGYIFSSFMTRIGAMAYGVKNNPRGISLLSSFIKLSLKSTILVVELEVCFTGLGLLTSLQQLLIRTSCLDGLGNE